MTTDYTIELHSIGVVQMYRGVSKVEEKEGKISFYNKEGGLFAIIPKEDIRQLVPVDQYDTPPEGTSPETTEPGVYR